MVEWLRHKDGGKMWFRRDKSQASGMIGVINVVFILQPENANQEGFKKQWSTGPIQKPSRWNDWGHKMCFSFQTTTNLQMQIKMVSRKLKETVVNWS